MPITPLFAVLLVLQQGSRSVAAEDPARVVWLATRAVEGDSGAAVSARWAARLRRDPADRAAELGMATIARLTYYYDAGERRYARLLPPAGQRADRYAAYARLGNAQGIRARGRMSDAEPWFVQAVEDARAAADSSAEVEATVGLMATRIRTRGVAAADSLLNQASRMTPAGDARLQGLVRCTRAVVLETAGRPEAALEADAGAELALRAGEPRLHASCRQVVAQNLLRRGDVGRAVTVWMETETEQRRARDRAGMAVTLQWRGYAYSTVGAYASALNDYRAAIAEGEASGNLSPVAFALSGLARISNQIGDAPAGMRYVSRAKALFDAQGDRVGALSMLTAAAELSRMAGRPADAAARYRDALAIALRDGPASFVVPVYTSLVDLALGSGDAAAASQALDSAAAFARTRGMPGWLAGLSYQRGMVALANNDLEAAARFFEENARGAVNPFRVYRARARVAEVLARRGDVAQAERELVTATDTRETWREKLSDSDLRLHVFQLRETTTDPDLGIALVLGRLAETGRVEVAFRLAERRRARELLDRLTQASTLRVGTADSTALRRPGSAALGLAEVAAGLPDSQTAVLEYVTGRGGEPTTVFVVTRNGGTAHLLPPLDSLTDAIGRFVALVEGGNPPEALARSLGRALVDPVLAALSPAVNHLVIVPDDVLHHLPFDALVTADGHRVVERFVTSIAPSATVAVQLWNRPRSTGGSSLLAFADPVFPSTGPGSADAAGDRAGEAGLELPRLPASRAEAQIAARHASRAEVRVRDRAGEAFLKSAALSGYAVVHFATHALVDEASIARTVLVLSPGDGEDGFVAPGDLAALRLDADLVVLSACRTAGGVMVRGEGIQGLTAPLLQAGARSILATQWRVPDRATSRFISEFYDKVATGLPVSDALRQTKLDALQRGAPASEWAAFVLVGDPFARLFAR